MRYVPLPVTPVITVDALYSLHYFGFRKGYAYPGEKHDFWELVYVDGGAATIGNGEERIPLSSGQCVLHAPDVFHTIEVDLAPSANMFVISFSSRDTVLRSLCGHALALSTEARRCVRRIMVEGQSFLGHVLDVTNQRELVPLNTAQMGASQYIALNLQMLLLLLLRSHEDSTASAKRAPISDEADAMSVLTIAERYMQAHLDGSIHIEDIGRACGVSPSKLKQLFRQKLNKSVMEHYRSLRLQEACRMLRTGRTNISQTAYALGYSSVPAFTRQFRDTLGLTPGAFMLLVNDSLPPLRDE